MNETPNLELFYDVLDESISKLYEVKKQSFLKLLIESGRNIIAQDVLNKEATSEQREESKTSATTVIAMFRSGHSAANAPSRISSTT